MAPIISRASRKFLIFGFSCKPEQPGPSAKPDPLDFFVFFFVLGSLRSYVFKMPMFFFLPVMYVGAIFFGKLGEGGTGVLCSGPGQVASIRPLGVSSTGMLEKRTKRTVTRTKGCLYVPLSLVVVWR